MAVTYNKTNWVNDVTPLDADNMNNIENGIENLVNEFNAGSGSTITVDSELSETSENPVQNKVITAGLNNKADINNPLSLIAAYRKSNGFLMHDYNSGTKTEKYVLNAKDGVTLDDTIYGKSKIPSSYVVAQYVKESVANKVDKIEGKGLSTNDFTDEDKAKVEKIADVVQTTGQSETSVMSQKASTDELDALKSDIADLQAALIGVSDLIGGDV